MNLPASTLHSPALTDPAPFGAAAGSRPGDQPADTSAPREMVAWLPQVHQARSGDLDAFAALVERFGPSLLSYLHRMTGHRQDAEDLTQETFVKAFRNLPSCQEPKAFPAWLFTIARRTALNRFRAAQPTEPLDPDIPSPEPHPADTAAATDHWHRLWALAQTHLRPPYHEVLWLHYAQQLPIQDVARITGRTALHVRVLLHRSRRALLRLATQHQLIPRTSP